MPSAVSEFREAFERLLSERFADLEARLNAELESERDRARRDLSGDLSRAIRRVVRAAGEGEWAPAVLDATAPFASLAALFLLDHSLVKGSLARGADVAGVEVPLALAPAFAAAASSGETVVAMRNAAELSGPIAAVFEAAPPGRCFIFPIAAGGGAAALLYAEGDATDSAGMEAVAAVASAALSGLRAKPAAVPAPFPDWDELSRGEQALHLRAQRFARVRAAEMRLYKTKAVETGRAHRRVYSELKEEIDSARETFHRQFVSATPTMADYLHLELLRTLADDDVAVLGEDYPGPLV